MSESDFLTRQEFQAFAKELREQLKAEIHHAHFKRERDHLATQGRWVPPLPEENK